MRKYGNYGSMCILNFNRTDRHDIEYTKKRNKLILCYSFFVKAYFINQDDFPVASEADLAKLDQETAAVRQQLQNLNDQVRIMEGKIRALTSELTTAEAEKKRDQLKKETKELEAKLEMLSGQGQLVYRTRAIITSS